MSTKRYWIVVALVMLVGVSFIGSPFFDHLPLQHIPTAIAIAIFLTLSRKYPLSNRSFACIAIFMLLHVLGARYVYSNVPYDEWTKAVFGKSINEIFGWSRNHYDRFVHFAYGFLFYIPAIEVLTRFISIPKKRAWYFALEFVMASSMLYELIEWFVAIVLAPDIADAYNGQQGDMWDSQKDMALAIFGALLALLVTQVAYRSKKKTEPAAHETNSVSQR